MGRLRTAFVLWACLLLALAALCAPSARADEQWLVVSDIHLNPFDRSADPSAPGDDTNDALFRSAMTDMHRVVTHPAMVLIGGDFLAHRFPARARAADGSGAAERDAVASMAQIAHAFDAAFPRAHFAIVLGNNDDPCGDYRSEVGGSYFAALAKIWAPLVNRDGAAPHFAQTFARNGDSVVSADGGRLRIFALNDIYWSFFYDGGCERSSSNPAVAEHEWMAKTLKAMPPSAHAVVLMHVPPGIDSTSTAATARLFGVPYLHGTDERELLAAWADPKNRVLWALAGHTHRNDMRVLGNVPLLLVSALSPVYRNEPQFSVLDVRSDGTIRDVQTYAFGDDGWTREPSFDEAWHVSGFSRESIASIHAQLENDATLRQAWATRYTGWAWRVDDITP